MVELGAAASRGGGRLSANSAEREVISSGILNVPHMPAASQSQWSS